MVTEPKGALGETEEAESEGKKGGNPMIMIGIIVAIVAVLGGVGWFIVWPMIFPAPAADPDAENGQTQETAEEIVEENVSKRYDPKHKPGIIEFDNSFTIKLRRQAGVLAVTSYLKMSLSLEVENPKIQKLMEEDVVVMNRIRDTINVFFASKTPVDVQVSKWPQLKAELMSAINDQFPEEYKILRVNVSEFLEQSSR